MWNRTPSKTGPLVARGGRAVERLTDLCGCDIVFVTVSGPADLEQVVCGEHGLLSGLQARHDRGLLSPCPLTPRRACARLRAVREPIPRPPRASGNATSSRKEVRASSASGPAEVFGKVFLGSTVLGSDWVRKRAGDLVKRDWTPTFTTELLRKDFDLGLDAARSLEVPMPVGATVYQLIQSAIGTGLRDQDFLSLYEPQARGAALGELPGP